MFDFDHNNLYFPHFTVIIYFVFGHPFVFLTIISCLLTVIWYQVFLSNNNNHHHHHHVVPLARISLTLSRHFFLSFIASGRSSGLHPVSSHSYCMYVRAGHPAFDQPYAGVHRSTSLMSLSLLLQQCPACLVRLTSNLDSFRDGRQVTV